MLGARVPFIVYVRVSRTPAGPLGETSCVWIMLVRTRALTPDGLELERHGVGHAGLSIDSQPLSSRSQAFRVAMKTSNETRMPRSVFISHGSPSGICAHHGSGSLSGCDVSPQAPFSQDCGMLSFPELDVG